MSPNRISSNLPYSLTWPAKKIFCFDILDFVKKYGQVRFFHLFEFFLKFRLFFEKFVKRAIFVLKFRFIKSEHLKRESRNLFMQPVGTVYTISVYSVSGL